MKIRALKSFAGLVAMVRDEERNVRDEIAADLIKAGYAVCIEDELPPKDPDPDKPVAPKAKPKSK